MRIILTVEVPGSIPPNEVEQQLLKAQQSGHGITIVTPRRHYMDVDLVGVERGA